MRFIVSPAKKMSVVDDAFGWRDLPMFADRAARLADTVRALSYDEAKALWQCSDALAELNFERFRTLEVRSGALTPAVLAYEGIQYQNLAPQVMTMEQLDYLQEHLRILSGLYGVVRPLDGVGAVPPGNAGEARGGRRAQSLRVLGRQPEPRARGRNGRHREPGIGGIREGRRSLCGSLRGKSAHLPVRHRRRARSPRAALHRRESRARYHGALVRRERH